MLARLTNIIYVLLFSSFIFRIVIKLKIKYFRIFFVSVYIQSPTKRNEAERVREREGRKSGCTKFGYFCVSSSGYSEAKQTRLVLFIFVAVRAEAVTASQ